MQKSVNNMNMQLYVMGPVNSSGYTRNFQGGVLSDNSGYTKLKSAGRKLKKVMTSAIVKESVPRAPVFDESPTGGPWDTSNLEEEFHLEQILGKTGVSTHSNDSSDLNEISMGRHENNDNDGGTVKKLGPKRSKRSKLRLSMPEITRIQNQSKFSFEEQ